MFYLLDHHLMLLLCTVFFILNFVKYKTELLSEIITAQGNNINFLFNKNSGTKECKNPVQLCKLLWIELCDTSHNSIANFD